MVRYLGASATSAWQLAKAHYCAQQLGVNRFASVQVRYNLANREAEAEVLPLCQEAGIGVLAYSPLARGLLAGTHLRAGHRLTHEQTARARADTQAYRPSDYDVAEATQVIARERAASSAQVALAWLLSRPAVTAPLIGATKVRHVEDAVAALAIDLGGEVIDRLQAPYQPHKPDEFT
jgi:aryl-alcohol dehydrogenase-like predicted oxidoreductase